MTIRIILFLLVLSDISLYYPILDHFTNVLLCKLTMLLKDIIFYVIVIEMQ